MIPSNRRVKKEELPPEVLEAAGLADVEPLQEPPAPRAVPAPKKKSRYATVARAFVGAALVVGISTAVAWAARRHVMSSTRFAVTQIDVTGAHHRTNEDILRAAGLAVGANIFATDLDDARQKLLTDPWISDATFARRLPGTVQIQVTEREAGALVALGELFVATREGDVFKKFEPGDPAELPVVTGMSPERMSEDREGARRTIRRAIDLASDYERSSLAKKATLQEIHVAPEGAVTLVVGKAALSLVLGEPPFRKKLEEAARVLTELDKRGGGKPDAIMLDNEARPERVVVRMR